MPCSNSAASVISGLFFLVLLEPTPLLGGSSIKVIKAALKKARSVPKRGQPGSTSVASTQHRRGWGVQPSPEPGETIWGLEKMCWEGGNVGQVQKFLQKAGV